MPKERWNSNLRPRASQQLKQLKRLSILYSKYVCPQFPDSTLAACFAGARDRKSKDRQCGRTTQNQWHTYAHGCLPLATYRLQRTELPTYVMAVWAKRRCKLFATSTRMVRYTCAIYIYREYWRIKMEGNVAIQHAAFCLMPFPASDGQEPIV